LMWLGEKGDGILNLTHHLFGSYCIFLLSNLH